MEHTLHCIAVEAGIHKQFCLKLVNLQATCACPHDFDRADSLELKEYQDQGIAATALYAFEG